MSDILDWLPSLAEDDQYDPCKPEYLVPASEEVVAEYEANIRRQQIARLEAAVATREKSARRAEAAVVAHYRDVCVELRAFASRSIADARKVRCPVCLEVSPVGTVAIVLSCGHPLCWSCATKCATSGFNNCPVCRHPHDFDPHRLEQWRARLRHGSCGAGSSSSTTSEDLATCNLSGDHLKLDAKMQYDAANPSERSREVCVGISKGTRGARRHAPEFVQPRPRCSDGCWTFLHVFKQRQAKDAGFALL
mmetsp:Transcript_3871/g.9867  ORF Transcript_3871/g.9867 Transcript_3871/m.9867 type:complete len:250 (+) Transcript_3871:55-804(+)